MMAEKIPAHIDELLWRVAEAREDELTADFLRRYPDMRAKLATREAMVDAMKCARPVPPIPTQFVPGSIAAPSRKSRFWLAPVAVGLLVGIAFASYHVAKFSQAPVQPEEERATSIQSPIPVPPGGRNAGPLQSPDSQLNGTAPRQDEVRADNGLVVLPAETTLFAALAAIRENGLQIEIMPGLEDMPVSLTPNADDGTLALAPLPMLHAVRTAAGFEIVDNGPEGILILPAEKTTVIEEPPRLRTGDIGN